MSLAQTITRHFGGDWKGTYGAFPAPGHSHADRGMTVKDEPGAPDDVLIHSFNHDTEVCLAVKDECRRVGILPPYGQDVGKATGGGRRETGHYEYADRDGVVVYRTVRIEQLGRKKSFIAQRPDGRGGWASGIDGIPRVLYRLTDFAGAIAKASLKDEPMPTIYLVEGERKADKLASWGLFATSCTFGCKGWSREWGPKYAEELAGCRVIILPDNDDEGRKFAERAAKDIEACRGTAHIIELPGLPEKGDIMDWDGKAEDLAALVDGSPEDWGALDLVACAVEKAPAREWVVEGWVPVNKTTLSSGDGGVGKSLLEQMKATCVGLGLPFLGLETRRMPAAYLSWEDDAEELWRRQEDICAAMGVPMASLAGHLHLVSMTEEENPFVVISSDDSRGVTVTPLGRKIERLAERHNIGLLILDNASQIAGIDHNSTDEVTPFGHYLSRIAKRCSGAVILLHHTNKAGADYLGSVAYNNAFRSRTLIARPEDGHDPDVRIWTNPKANYSQAGGKIEFRWHKGAFVRDEDLPPNQAAEVAANMKAASVNAKFLQCLAKTKAEKRAVSVARSASNYAPTIFAAMTTGKGVTKRDYAEAMERLLHLGTIANDQPIYKRENRQWVRGLGLVEHAPTLAPTHAPTDAQTCTDHTVKVAENGDLNCTNLHALAPYISKDIEGAPLGVGPPSKDDIQWDEREGDDD